MPWRVWRTCSLKIPLFLEGRKEVRHRGVTSQNKNKNSTTIFYMESVEQILSQNHFHIGKKEGHMCVCMYIPNRDSMMNTFTITKPETTVKHMR
jgi:hypothetical protein